MIMPRFLFDSESLIKAVAELQRDLPSYKLAFSVKTNSHPAVIRLFHQLGLQPEVVSEYEYEYVSEVLRKKTQMIINGPVKKNDFLSKCIESSDYIQASSIRELINLDLLNAGNRLLKVGLRLNYGDNWKGKYFSRFGVEINEELKYALLNLKNINVIGLHFHIPFRTLDSYHHRSKFISKALTILSDWGLDIKIINMGGGLQSTDYPFRNDSIKYLEELAVKNPKIKFLIEPGTAILANIFSYECSVIDVIKVADKIILQTDGSRLDYSRSACLDKVVNLYRQNKLVSELTLKSNLDSCRQILSGSSCIESDFMGGFDGVVDVRVGDVFRIKSVGSYSYVFKSPFITPIPPVYDCFSGYQLTQSPSAKDYISYVEGR